MRALSSVLPRRATRRARTALPAPPPRAPRGTAAERFSPNSPPTVPSPPPPPPLEAAPTPSCLPPPSTTPAATSPGAARVPRRRRRAPRWPSTSPLPVLVLVLVLLAHQLSHDVVTHGGDGGLPAPCMSTTFMGRSSPEEDVWRQTPRSAAPSPDNPRRRATRCERRRVAARALAMRASYASR